MDNPSSDFAVKDEKLTNQYNLFSKQAISLSNLQKIIKIIVEYSNEFVPFFNINGTFYAASYSSDNKYLAIAGIEDMKIFDGESFKLLNTTANEYGSFIINVLKYSPNNKYLYGAIDYRDIYQNENSFPIRIFDANSFKTLQKFPTGHNKAITSLSCSPDGKHLASGSDDKTIKIWSLNDDIDNKLLHILNDNLPIKTVLYSPNGQNLASISEYGPGVKIWNSNTYQFEHNLAHEYVRAVSYSPENKHLASANGQNIKIWDANTYKILFDLPPKYKYIISLDYSKDGKYLTASTISETMIYDTNTYNILQRISHEEVNRHGLGQNILFSPNHNFLISYRSDVKILINTASYLLDFDNNISEKDVNK